MEIKLLDSRNFTHQCTRAQITPSLRGHMHPSAALYLLVTCVTDEPQLRDEQMWFGCDQTHRLRALNALELNVEGTLICWERSSIYCSDVTVDPCPCFANPVRLSHARASFTVRSQRARGETLRSRAAHRPHSLARSQSRVHGPNNGTCTVNKRC